MSTPRLRVAIADDTPAMTEFLAELIGLQPDMELIAVARNTPSAVALAERHQPDVIVLDVRMPGGGGMVAAPAIRALNPSIRIVALSTHSERSVIDAMLGAGADDYVVKGPDLGLLLNAIRGPTHRPGARRTAPCHGRVTQPPEKLPP